MKSSQEVISPIDVHSLFSQEAQAILEKKKLDEKLLDFYTKFKSKFNPKLVIRPMIRFIKSQNRNNLIGVEIGVADGFNAKLVLEELNIETLYLIDPWDYYEESEVELDYSNYLTKAKTLLSSYNGKTKFIKKYSKDAVNDVPNNLDFVYIDGNHQYEFVKEDIELYYPKIKKGGIIGGDDFWIQYFGVIQAVTEFVTKNKLKLYLEKKDWWVVKD